MNLFGFLSTIILFIIFSYLKKYRFIKKIPIIISVGVVLIFILKIFDIEYEEYMFSASYLTFLIAPATIALAYPMYKNAYILSENKTALYSSIVFATFFSIFITYLCAKLFGADIKIISSLLPKSTTMPIALEISKNIEGYLELTACTVVLSGVFGGVFGHKILKIFKIKSDIATGIAIGSASHVIGTAACAERKKDKQTAASTIALILVGILSSVIIPLFKHFF